MNTTGISKESFNIKFENKTFNKGDCIDNKQNYINTIWGKIKKFFGCYSVYHCIVQDEPKQEGSNFVYTLKYSDKTIKIFGIKIITIKIK